MRIKDRVIHVKLYREYEVIEQTGPFDTPCTLQLGMPINEIQIPGLQAGVWEVRVAGMESKRGVEAPVTISRFLIAE